MNLGFWQKVIENKPKDRPIFVLAPMANVTDAAFRRVIAKHSNMGKKDGGPDVLWTEFVSADGLMLAPAAGKKKLLTDLVFSKNEHPIVAQFFTSRPEIMEKAAYLAAELGFDGVDINMGCPDRSIEKQGAGAALMKNPKLAKEIIRAAKRGVESYAREHKKKEILSVSVKTRIGYSKDETETWIPALLEEEPAVITIHARTRKEMSKVPARWEHVRRAVEIRDSMKSQTLIFGNGDVLTLADGELKAKNSGADGVMFGRAIFGNPWLFDQKRTVEQIPLKEKLAVLVEHVKLFDKLLGKIKNFAIMKKHFKAYVHDFDGAAELRAKLMAANTAKEVIAVINGLK